MVRRIFVKKVDLRYSIFFSIFSLVITICLTSFIFREYKKDQQHERDYFLNIYSLRIKHLIEDLSFTIKMGEGIIKLTKNSSFENDELDYLFNLIVEEHSLRNISILPDGIVRYVYPLENNKEAIGDNVFVMQNRKKEVEIAIRTKEIIISGPDRLTQGGEGVSVRKAIFNKDGSFWGMVALIVDLDKLNSSIDLYSLKKLGYEYELYSNVNGKDKIIMDRSDKFKEGQIDFISIPLANGEWCFGIYKNTSITIYLILALILGSGLFFSYLTYIYLRKRELKIKLIKQDLYLDKLTNLYNIKKLDELKSLENFTLFFIDLNDFKAINDTYGHGIGDKLLIFFSTSLKSILRDKDFAIRNGGDEFLLVINGIFLQKDVDSFCERLERLKKLKMPYKKGDIYIKFSYGYVISTEENKNINELIKKADENMYKNKRNDKKNSK